MSNQQTSPEKANGNTFLSCLIVLPALLLALAMGGSGAVLIYGAINQKLARPYSNIVETTVTGVVTTTSPASSAAGHGLAETPALDKQALIAEGQKLYSASCMACHQPTGQGMPNVFPPLAGSDWICNENADCAIAVVLGGLQGPITVNEKPFTTAMAMPPHALMLDDGKIAAILTYVRNSWGNEGFPVSPTRVSELREKFKSRSAMWTQQEVHAAIHGTSKEH